MKLLKKVAHREHFSPCCHVNSIFWNISWHMQTSWIKSVNTFRAYTAHMETHMVAAWMLKFTWHFSIFYEVFQEIVPSNHPFDANLTFENRFCSNPPKSLNFTRTYQFVKPAYIISSHCSDLDTHSVSNSTVFAALPSGPLHAWISCTRLMSSKIDHISGKKTLLSF